MLKNLSSIMYEVHFNANTAETLSRVLDVMSVLVQLWLRHIHKSTFILVVQSVLEQTHVGCTGSKFSALTLMNLVASTALSLSLVSSSSNVTMITVSAMGKECSVKTELICRQTRGGSYFNFKKVMLYNVL